MIRARTVVAILASGAVFGLVIALPLGRHRQISVELWLVGVAAWTGLALVSRVLATAPIEEPRVRPLLRWRTADAEPPARLPRSLLALEGTLLAARDSERAFTRRLRPRLRAVAHHRLRIDHGIDPDREPERATAALGDVAWLIDGAGEADLAGGSGEARTPTIAEIDRLLDRLERPAASAESRPQGASP